MLPASIIIPMLGFILFFVLSEKNKYIFYKILFGLALGLYIQGNYINISYGSGVLDGSDIAWDHYTRYGVLDTSIWIVCLAFPFILLEFLKPKTDKFYKVISYISIFLTVIQIPAFIVQIFSYNPNGNTEFSITKQGMFELSGDENVIIFVLDTLDEEYYSDFITKNPDYTDKLEGFSHYENVIGSGARTFIAVPSMFSGIPFTYSELYSEYKDKIYGDENPLAMMHKSGYDIGLYSETPLFSEKCVDYITNFDSGGAKVGSRTLFANKVFKLTMFKFVPHYLKKYFLMDTSEFDEAIDKAETYAMNSTSDTAFYNDFREQRFTIGDGKKSVRIYHLRGAHKPYRMLNNGDVGNGATVESQVAGNFTRIAEMLKDLKEKGIYDKTTVIITADHGDINLAERPIFLIKEKNSIGKYQTKRESVSLFDLPVFLEHLTGEEDTMNKYGEDIHSLKEGEKRERHFFYNAGVRKADYEIVEYVTTEDAWDTDALREIKSYKDIDGSEVPYSLGTVLRFDSDTTGNRYAVEGFAENSGFSTRLRGAYAKMEIPFYDLPKTGTLNANIRLHSLTKRGLEYIIKANGKEVKHDNIDDKAIGRGISFDIDVNSFDTSKVLALEFEFPTIPDEQMDEELLNRTTTFWLISMKIDK